MKIFSLKYKNILGNIYIFYYVHQIKFQVYETKNFRWIINFKNQFI